MIEKKILWIIYFFCFTFAFCFKVHWQTEHTTRETSPHLPNYQMQEMESHTISDSPWSIICQNKFRWENCEVLCQEKSPVVWLAPCTTPGRSPHHQTPPRTPDSPLNFSMPRSWDFLHSRAATWGKSNIPSTPTLWSTKVLTCERFDGLPWSCFSSISAPTGPGLH